MSLKTSRLMFAVLLLGSVLMAASPGQAQSGGGDPYRRVTCYVKDSRGNEYQASGFRRDLDRVKRRAIRVCEYNSERPSTCRLLRCRP